MSNAPSLTLLQFPTRIIACGMLATFGAGMSVWAYQFNGPAGPLLTWGVFPGVPFVVLSGLSLVPGIPLRVTIGAYIGGVLAIAVPYGAIWYESLRNNVGGANIGLGILLIATIVLLPIPMLVGGLIGWVIPAGKLVVAGDSKAAGSSSEMI